MEIKNNYKSTIYWWSYNTNDTIYGVALNKGEVAKGKTGSWRDSSFTNFKLQIARDWKKGLFKINEYTTIYGPGEKCHIDDKFTVTSDGKAIKEMPVVGNERIQEQKITEINFRDLRGHSKDQEEEITSTFYKAYSHTMAQSSSSIDSKTWNIDGKVSGSFKGKKGTISAGFQSKVENTLKKNFESVVSQSLEETRTKKLFFEAKKISMIQNVWLTQIKTGTISYFGEEAEFVVPISTNSSSLEVQTTFDSPDEMPQSIREVWDKHFG